MDSKTKIFIDKANKKHNNKYNYSKTKYVNNIVKIIIICKEHGEFLQRPRHHLRGSGCTKCAKTFANNKITKTLEQFIKEVNNKHNYKYDYSKTKYINWKTNVTIICKKHGEFQQTPNNHLSGNGCSKCGRVSSYIKQSLVAKNAFIPKAREIHGDKYDYSQAKYINWKTNVTIICKKHGKFYQQPNNHLNGNGCKICAFNGMKTTIKEFIEKAKKIHGDKYNYSKVKYINSVTKTTIICKKHGEFLQAPKGHLNGRGCDMCGRQQTMAGYSKASIKWLDYISNKYSINIQHAENKGEYRIKNSKYRADGYCKKFNTVFCYHGCIFHGCKRCFNENDISPISKKLYKDLYNYTMKREKFIKSQGYNVITIWGCEWNNKNTKMLHLDQEFLQIIKIYIYM